MRRFMSGMVVVFALALLTLGVAGCGATTSTAAESATTHGLEAEGETIGSYAASPGNFIDLDPSSGCAGENVIHGNLYETLTLYNPPGSAELIGPKLATGWETSADGLEWTFRLRPGVKFHDGTDFDAKAVKYSIERTKRIGLCDAYWFDPIEAIETPDDLTVLFKLANPAPLDLIFSSAYSAWIMSPTAVAEQGAEWFAAGNEAGTGPYRIERYEPGQRMVLTRFADYWGGWEEDQIDKVVFEIVDDPTVVEQMLRARAIDFAPNVPADSVAPLQEVDGLEVVTTPSFTVMWDFLNTARAPTDSRLVRQALAYSFPYDQVLASMNDGNREQANGPVPARLWGRNPAGPRYTFDPGKAAALLAEAGYGDGMELTFAVMGPDEQRIGELWRAELARLGVNLELQPMTFAVLWDQVKNDPAAAPHVIPFQAWPDVVSPYTMLYLNFHSQEPTIFNFASYDNPAFDKLVDEANVLTGSDRAAAIAKFIAAQEMLVEDAPAIFIKDVPNRHVISSDLRGYVDNPAYPHVVFWYELRR